MKKLALSILLIGLSAKIFPQNWQESTFELNSTFSTRNFSSDMEQSALTVDMLKQHVSGAWGAKFSGELSQVYLSSSNSELEKHHTTANISGQGILFLSRGNQVTGGLGYSESIAMPEEDFSNTLLIAQSPYQKDQQSGFINYTKGLDNAFFYLEANGSFLQQEKTYFDASEAFSKTQSQNFGLTSLWRQTESTQWGFKLETKKTKEQREEASVDYEVTNLFLSSKTQIFKRSEIFINLGQTATNTQDSFSWDISALTHVSEHLDFTLSSNRTYASSALLQPQASLKTTNQFSLNYALSDVVAFSGRLKQETRSNGSGPETQLEKFAVGVNYDYSERWQIQLQLTEQSQTNKAAGIDLNNQTIQFNITGALL